MAYEVLSNPEKRKLYDQAGEQGIKEGGSGGGGGMNPMDIFDMFFGGGGGGDPFGRGRQRGPRRTKNLVHQLSVSLEDMYNGTVRKLALQKNWNAGPDPAARAWDDAADPEYVSGMPRRG